jgi:RNA polymerase sigma-70 factor (ECF subfamily)
MEHAALSREERAKPVPTSAERRVFLELVDSHGSAIVGMLRRLCGNPHDADDVFQETAVRVWRNLPNRPRLRNPRGWLATIAYRCFLDHCRRRSDHGGLEEAPDHRLKGPDDQAEHSEECRRLNAAVEELPQPVREVIVLHYTGGLTLSQTAEAMGISVGTVKSRLNSALERLRSVLV